MRTVTYGPGDWVYPADLPRRFLCRVIDAQRIRITGGCFQVLALEPIEGPWPAGTRLVRESAAVRPAEPPPDIAGHAA
jgi:hypothetical protein